VTFAPSLTELIADEVRVVATSRLATPAVLDFIGTLDVVRLPAVRGRTLWHLAGVPCVVEQPNGLGNLEADIPTTAIVVTTSSGVALPPNAERVVHLRGESASGQARSVALAQLLQRRFVHMRGVHAVTPTVESARFVVVLSAPVGRLSEVPVPAGIAMSLLGAGLPEYAGGVRFDVLPDAVESVVLAYAGAVADVFADTRGPR
jgi:hypothetical protein